MYEHDDCQHHCGGRLEPRAHLRNDCRAEGSEFLAAQIMRLRMSWRTMPTGCNMACSNRDQMLLIASSPSPRIPGCDIASPDISSQPHVLLSLSGAWKGSTHIIPQRDCSCNKNQCSVRPV